MSEAFGLDPEVTVAMAAPLGRPEAGAVFWLLEEDGIARSAVVSCRVDDAVTVWCMSTPPAFARRGYGRALLSTVLDDARGDGATIGLPGATPAGFPLYASTGWRTVEGWSLFVNVASAQFSH